MQWLIGLVIKLFFKYILTPKNIRNFAIIAVNAIEKYVLGTASKVDDKAVLPAVKAIKEAFNL